MKWQEGDGAMVFVRPDEVTIINVFIRPEVAEEYRDSGQWSQRRAWEWTVKVNEVVLAVSKKRRMLASAQDEAFKRWRRWHDGQR